MGDDVDTRENINTLRYRNLIEMRRYMYFTEGLLRRDRVEELGDIKKCLNGKDLTEQEIKKLVTINKRYEAQRKKTR